MKEQNGFLRVSSCCYPLLSSLGFGPGTGVLVDLAIEAQANKQGHTHTHKRNRNSVAGEEVLREAGRQNTGRPLLFHRRPEVNHRAANQQATTTTTFCTRWFLLCRERAE